MQLEIKLYGHLLCQNEKLESYKRNRLNLEMPEGTTLKELHRLIFVDPAENLVSIVDGRAQLPDYALEHSCSVSIFRPMGGRTHNPFEKIK